MNQRRYRRRALHGVGQPGVQQELRRLAHGAHEEKQTDQRQRIDVEAEELYGLADLIGRRGEHGVVLDGVEQREHGEDAERETEIADTIDKKSLDGGTVSRGSV